MKPANESPELWTPLPPPAEAVLERLERLSLRPEFAAQRELGLRRALRPYLELGPSAPLSPLPQEVRLATLLLLADFFPEDGQLSLIEQLRDVITEHIPNEERAWLDPLKHSTMDLLAVERLDEASGRLRLRSLGDRRDYSVRSGEWASGVTDRVLLTRLIRDPNEADEAYWVAGCAVTLSPADAGTLVEMTHEWRRDLEIAAGAFGLGEWGEFAKRYGHVLLWTYTQLRFAGLVEAVRDIRYQTPDGAPYLYAVALYDHNEYRFLSSGMDEIESFASAGGQPPQPTGGLRPVRRWEATEERDGRHAVVARVTLTPTQLLVEADGRERLNQVKHRLAAAFGFSLHFRGESEKPPARAMSLDDLMKAEPAAVLVSPDEDREVLAAFLETAYLEWADKGSPALGGLTPRHAAAQPATRPKVAALIEEMERNDLGLTRTGRRAFEYDRLRAHVGLEEVRR